ncbi:bifunctional metallophosphatase/5'-nucleotidase [Roseateles koreensis]|uniref:Bifunctional metallophosphatase/5'-nucleotidase n=1 Tax=Roseateles koreensis TaxID=2987526 RepID=A0ABT5KP78_9BURK|nr:bifunctional metallophosphatase/5'-nucleotidase [Roseateles koreensis]MDC8783607.1 bifunctional metallophosphatase/5'-nucleotidase [Roseateles koreensis]
MLFTARMSAFVQWRRTGASLALVSLLAACAQPGSTPADAKPPAAASAAASVPQAVLLRAPLTHELSIFSINDFHGNIQSQLPTPLSPRLPDAYSGELKAQPAGGVAYLATAIRRLRAERANSLFVAAGDLIGASPQISSLLKDEPTLAALGQLDLVGSALGNHELDAGLPELLRKAHGDCLPQGCLWPDFKGPGFPYLAANLLDAKTGQTILPSYVIKQVDGVKIAFVGAITKDTPSVVVPRAIVGLRFADEAATLNALVPQLRAEGAQLLVAVIHEGAEYRGAANDPSYACPGLQGRGVEIAHELDAAYGLIITGHTHQAYTCKVAGRLLVQGGSYGGWITESRLTLDGAGKVLDAQAINHPVLQSRYVPSPELAALVDRAAALTAPVRLKPVALLAEGANRAIKPPLGDSTLGNLIADSQLAYAKKHGGADIALMNTGGIRADLVVEPGQPVTLSDLVAIQPFGNELVALTLTGAQLRELLQHQLPKGDSAWRFLQVSSSLRYHWHSGPDGQPQLGEVKVNGQPLQAARAYRVVVNNFMAEGGDGNSILGRGRERVTLGQDIDALVAWLSDNPAAVSQAKAGRIVRD